MLNIFFVVKLFLKNIFLFLNYLNYLKYFYKKYVKYFYNK